MPVPRIACFPAALLLATASLIAADEKPAAPASEAKSAFATAGSTYTDATAAQHVGEEATVTGKVTAVSASRHGNTYLNFGGRFPKQTFSGVILSKDAEKLKDPKEFEGKTVAITGKIELYNEKPQIVISSPTQIRILETAEAAKP